MQGKKGYEHHRPAFYLIHRCRYRQDFSASPQPNRIQDVRSCHLRREPICDQRGPRIASDALSLRAPQARERPLQPYNYNSNHNKNNNNDNNNNSNNTNDKNNNNNNNDNSTNNKYSNNTNSNNVTTNNSNSNPLP